MPCCHESVYQLGEANYMFGLTVSGDWIPIHMRSITIR